MTSVFANQATTAEMLAAGPATWTLDGSHTQVGFAVKHLMISTVKGRFTEASGQVVLDPTKEPEVDIAIGAASIHTGDERRDAHLRSADFLHAEKYPTLRFRGDSIDGDIGGRFTLEGQLTIRDVTRTVTLNVQSEGRVTDPWGNDRIGYTATATINRKDFGLAWNVALEAGGVMVGDDVKLTIEAELVRK
jgi:polyisoprenoid-binding protein YceI